MELAFLSALLEHRQKGHQSKRFTAIKKFFESAVSVVPLDSLFHAIAKAESEVVFQCCELFRSDTLATINLSSEVMLSSMESALSRIVRMQHEFFSFRYSGTDDFGEDILVILRDNMLVIAGKKIADLRARCKTLIDMGLCQDSPYNIDLEVIYPSNDVSNTREGNEVKCCKPPITLLNTGKQELNRLSEELITEHSQLDEESMSSNTNIKMLSVLTNLRVEFQTCSTLLGAFMESQVQIPLEKAIGDGYLNKVAEQAKSFGLSVWGLLILPFKVLNQLVRTDVSEDIRQFVIEFSHKVGDIYSNMFPLSVKHFPGYEERLEFLLGSMKQSWTCNQNYVSYSLERQLEDHCKKRNIYHYTPVDEILNQWNANFENETLTLIPNDYRPLVARWIRWSLMINNLRESLANQTAVGVIGLINSGKSKFVRSFFGKEVRK